MVFFDFLSIDFQKKLYICNRETPKEKTLIYTAKKLFHTLMAPPRVKAAYWQHVYYGPDKRLWSVFDFTKDWSHHPESKIASQFSDRPWTNRCNTSREMVHIDNNTPIAGATNVYVNSQE